MLVRKSCNKLAVIAVTTIGLACGQAWAGNTKDVLSTIKHIGTPAVACGTILTIINCFTFNFERIEKYGLPLLEHLFPYLGRSFLQGFCTGTLIGYSNFLTGENEKSGHLGLKKLAIPTLTALGLLGLATWVSQ